MFQFIHQKITNILADDKKRELVVYLIFGGLTTLVSIGSLWLLLILFPQTDKNILNAFSIIIAVLFAYVTNRTYVFKSTSKNILQESLKFFGSRAFSAGLEMIFFYVLETLLKVDAMISKIIVTVVVIIVNYFTSKFIVFKKKDPSKPE